VVVDFRREKVASGMIYQLRDYQKESSNTAVARMRKLDGKPFILVLATGAGKSLVIADICHQLDEPVLIIQPGKEILEQNYGKLKSYGIEDIAMYSASVGQRNIAKFTYATIQSIHNKPELFKKFRHVILDECHQLNPKNENGMLTKFLKAIDCQSICGLTATPYRLSQKYFWENGMQFYTSHLKMINRIHPFFFKSIVYKIETADLIEQGYLSPILYRADKEVDMLGFEVNSTGADFTTESLENFWDDKRLQKMARIIQKIDEKCQRNLIFCSSLRQANRCRELLSRMEIVAEVVDGKTPMSERTRLVEGFKTGRFKHMINVGVFTTGFDVPELDCIVLARPTMSLALYYQMVGRGVRLDPARPDKKLRVYDLAGVVAKLGRVETIKVVKEDDGWKDKVVSEVGDMSEVPLFKFLVKKNMFTKKEEANV
jgi:DNA repair protein RadD